MYFSKMLVLPFWDLVDWIEIIDSEKVTRLDPPLTQSAIDRVVDQDAAESADVDAATRRL